MSKEDSEKEVTTNLTDMNIDKSIGMLIGLAIGDALGAPLEFKEASPANNQLT